MKRLLPLLLLAATALPAQAQKSYDRLAMETRSPGYPAMRVKARDASIQIVTRDGRLALVLTQGALTMQLTDRALREIEQRTEGDAAAARGQGEFTDVISAAVRGTVHESMRRGYQYQLRDLRSARFEDGRLIIVDRDGREVLGGVETDGKPAMGSFLPEHAQEFVREFNRLKNHAS